MVNEMMLLPVSITNVWVCLTVLVCACACVCVF